MKLKHVILLGVLALLTPLFLYAQTNNPAGPEANPPAVVASANGLLLTLIPLFVPLLVELGKAALPFVPLWLLPILAAALGVLIDWVASLVSGGSASPLTATIASAAGVGLREIVDQLNKRMKASKAVGSVVVLIFCLGCLGTGCAWFNPEAVKPAPVAAGQDAVVVNAERIQETSLFAYERMINWELTHRAVLPVEVSRAVDAARKSFRPNWEASRAALREYQTQRGANLETVNRLTTALSVAQSSFLKLTGSQSAGDISAIFTSLHQLSEAVKTLKK